MKILPYLFKTESLKLFRKVVPDPPCSATDHDFRIKWQSWDGQTKIGMRKCAKCGLEEYYKLKEGKDDEKDSAEN